jgi:uncharacterized CHY-type Zn-finger protein
LEKRIGNVRVEGLSVDPQTRCAHYRGPTDIIAIKFACCGRWFPCFECHAEVAGHDAEVWPTAKFGERAILCGVCGGELIIEEYLACDALCPTCGSEFNPRCSLHYHLYFETEQKAG